MGVINTTTLAVVSLSQFRDLFPNVSFPADPALIDFAAYGYSPILDAPLPDYDPTTHAVQSGTPVQDGDVWRETWDVVSLSDAALEIVRRTTRILTRVQFLQRLTPQEWYAAKTSTVPEVAYFVDLIMAAQEIDLDDAQTQAGMQIAVSAGLMTADRSATILNS